jgi:hypothetical protein
MNSPTLHTRHSLIAAGLAGLAVIAGTVTATGHATAAPFARGTFHDEFTNTVTEFCGVPGLTVHIDGAVEGRYLDNPHGPDGLVYIMEHLRLSTELTNPATGKTVTGRENTVYKDQTIVDNGDGTLTITVLGTGNLVFSAADGKAIARDPGQTRFQVLIDHGGTPTDPSDDAELEFLGVVKGSTGRSDDVCAALVAALT